MSTLKAFFLSRYANVEFSFKNQVDSSGGARPLMAPRRSPYAAIPDIVGQQKDHY
jgi:hypothetical protein